MMQSIIDLLGRIVWGPASLAALLLTGLYFSSMTGFFQIRKMGGILREVLIKSLRPSQNKKAKGTITPFQALTTALAGTIGTGNIAGVAAAVALAGPGAVFWMWASALLGMMTKYAEIVLAITYRRKNPKGGWIGGPMYYIRDGLGQKPLAALYAVLGAAAAFGVGNMTQVNSMASAVEAAFGLPPLYSAAVLSLLTGLTIAGGIKSIAKTAERLIPLMSLFFTGATLWVIAFNWRAVPGAFSLILTHAFTPAAPIGGFAGAAVATAIQKGISRGIFTNEAGLGSASIAYATAETDSAARQGLWGIFEVFFDTIVMCTLTAVAILSTDAWHSGLTGTELTIAAFDTALPGAGKYVIALCLIFFAFASILAWFFYGKSCMDYLSGGRHTREYIALYLAATVIGGVLELRLVWELSDVLNGLMLLPNLIGLLGLGGVVVRLTRRELPRIGL